MAILGTETGVADQSTSMGYVESTARARNASGTVDRSGIFQLDILNNVKGVFDQQGAFPNAPIITAMAVCRQVPSLGGTGGTNLLAATGQGSFPAPNIGENVSGYNQLNGPAFYGNYFYVLNPPQPGTFRVQWFSPMAAGAYSINISVKQVNGAGVQVVGSGVLSAHSYDIYLKSGGGVEYLLISIPNGVKFGIGTLQPVQTVAFNSQTLTGNNLAFTFKVVANLFIGGASGQNQFWQDVLSFYL